MISVGDGPVVSVIMPCRNAAAYLSEAVESVLAQSWPFVELICINDGSVDNTLRILKSYGDRIHTLEGECRGANAARNLGVRCAQGEFIKFFDSDDILETTAIETQLKIAEGLKNEKLIISGGVIEIDSSGKSIGLYGNKNRSRDHDPIVDILKNSPITSCPLHRREAIAEVGGLDECIPSNHEHDLHFRLVLAGYRFHFHEDVIYRYRQHDNASRITRNILVTADPDWLLPYVSHQLNLLNQFFDGSAIPQRILSAVAGNVWRAGRLCFRLGELEKGERCVAFVKEMNVQPDADIGGALYRCLVKLFGPLFAERMGVLKESFTHR